MCSLHQCASTSKNHGIASIIQRPWVGAALGGSPSPGPRCACPHPLRACHCRIRSRSHRAGLYALARLGAPLSNARALSTVEISALPKCRFYKTSSLSYWVSVLPQLPQNPPCWGWVRIQVPYHGVQRSCSAESEAVIGPSSSPVAGSSVPVATRRLDTHHNIQLYAPTQVDLT